METFNRSGGGVVYLCAALQTFLKRRRTFANVMRKANPRALFSRAERVGKFLTALRNGFQVRFYSLRSLSVHMRVIFHFNSRLPLSEFATSFRVLRAQYMNPSAEMNRIRRFPFAEIIRQNQERLIALLYKILRDGEIYKAFP